MNTTHVRPRHPLRTMAGRMAVAVLHSPLRFLLEPGIAELAYTGPRSGRVISLPVMYARHGNQIVVLVGRAHHKSWWRNFRRPRHLQITVAGQASHGTAVVASPGTTEFRGALAAYRQRFSQVRFVPGDQLVIITLDAPD